MSGAGAAGGTPERPATFFADAAEFRAWLEENHESATELWMGLRKKHVPDRGLTWDDAVPEALCFGWIDSVVQRIDDDAVRQRWTPRRSSSVWSSINVALVERLIDEGKMTPAGLAAFEARTAEKTGRASYEQRPTAFPAIHLKTFKASKAAWDWFSSQPPGYRRTAIWFVVSAVKAETQAKRLQRLIEMSNERRRIIGPSGLGAVKPAR